MPYFTVDTTYDVDREKLLAARPAHRDYLATLTEKGSVVAAGPWSDDLGGFVVYSAADEAALHELLDEDPYTSTGVAAARSVREWKPVLGTWVR